MASLREEIIGDPEGIGYAAMSDTEATVSLNDPVRPRNRTSMTGREVRAAVDNAEYDGLSDAKKSQFLSLVGSDDLDPFGLPANVIKDIFGIASATVPALATARIELVSRAVEIGIRSPVRISHVIAARS